MMLLFQQDGRQRLKEYSESWRNQLDRSGDTWPILLGLMAVLLVLWLVVRLTRYTRATRAPQNAALFIRLCRAHQLSRGEIRLLRRLLKRSAAEDAAWIFIRRSLFESAATGLRADAASIEPLRRKLFAT